MTFRYVQLANEIESKILKGDFLTGEKLPSLRSMHQDLNHSISTVHQAYLELENRGIVEAKEKSGFFVKALARNSIKTPDVIDCKSEPVKVNVNNLANTIHQHVGNPKITVLGSSIPSNDILPLKHFARILKSVSPKDMNDVFGYDRSLGNLDLRRQIAKRSLSYSSRVSARDVVITSGCMGAVSACLKAIAKPGDLIGVETPTCISFLQLIEENAMYALELPTDLEKGVDVNSLEKMLDTYPVKACLFNPSFHNPLGYVMPTRRRKRLVELMNNREIPIIEDDVFGDLHFEERRPPTLKSFDQKGLVLYCSSYSKTLAPGLSVGWTLPGRFMDEVIALKTNFILSSPKLNQYLIVQFLRNGSYERQLRRIQNQLKRQMCDITRAIIRYFPKDTKISSPEGGLCLWVQLNDSIDSVELYKDLLEDNILVMPGALCSGSDKYRNCIRVGCGQPLDDHLEKTIQYVGEVIYDLIV